MSDHSSLSQTDPCIEAERPVGWRRRLLRRYRWLPLVLPLAVYMLVGTLEPDMSAGSSIGARGTRTDQKSQASELAQADCGTSYAVAYTIRITATLAAMIFVMPYYRSIPLRAGASALLVGLLGGVIWIVMCKLDVVRWGLSAVGLTAWMSLGARPAFDPLSAFAGQLPLLVGFLAVRLLGLVILVPLIEEFFVRGLLMRCFVQADWWEIPLGRVTVGSAVIATVYGVLTHPAEPLAAAVWFTLITGLYARTRNIWDCVVAHAMTNLVLGLYVLVWHDWVLW